MNLLQYSTFLYSSVYTSTSRLAERAVLRFFTDRFIYIICQHQIYRACSSLTTTSGVAPAHPKMFRMAGDLHLHQIVAYMYMCCPYHACLQLLVCTSLHVYYTCTHETQTKGGYGCNNHIHELPTNHTVLCP